MKYTYKYIVENRYDPNAHKARKIGDKYVLMTAISKALSPVPVYIFLNLGIHPDTITLISLLFILIGSGAFVVGLPLLGILFYLLFALFDSVDGDMARCAGPTSYGSVLDSFGADLFYACSPIAVSFYLFSKEIAILNMESSFLLLVGAFISATFMVYRLINAKVYKFMSNASNGSSDYTQGAKKKIRSGVLKSIVKVYRHVLVRGNFFAEPGMLFWFSILTIFKAHEVLAWYLLGILIYNIGYLSMNFFGTYIFFKTLRK